MKILHIVGLAHGGAGQHILSLATGCDPRRFRSTVAMAGNSPMRPQFEQAGVRVLPLEMDHYGGLRRNIAAFRQVSHILQREQFDVINTHTMVASILGRVAARRYTRTPVVHMLHAFAGQRFRTRLTRKTAVLIERRLDRLCDWYIAPSRAMIQHGVSHRIFAASKAVLISNGVDLRTLDRQQQELESAERPAASHANGVVTVGFLGRLESQKGVPHLIHAAALVRPLNPHVRFRIAGDGALRSELEKLAARLQVADVVDFVGWQRDRVKFLKEIDFMAMPSIWEAFGLSAAEAMAVGKPVIASRIDGLPEVIGDTGLLVPPANPEALAGAIVELAADPAKRRALGRKGRARVEQRFTLERMISRHEEFYDCLVSRGDVRGIAHEDLAPEVEEGAQSWGVGGPKMSRKLQQASAPIESG